MSSNLDKNKKESDKIEFQDGNSSLVQHYLKRFLLFFFSFN
jgi:hypothetical protein